MPSCNYCNKNLSSISSLNYHKKNTKKCLLLQETHKKNSKNGSNSKYEKLKIEHDILKAKYDKNNSNNEKLKIEHDMLKTNYEKMEKKYDSIIVILATKPTTTTTVNQNKTIVITRQLPTSEVIRTKATKSLTVDHIIGGQEGIAKFCIDEKIVTPDNYKLTDKARGNGRYKNKEGNIVMDSGIKHLTGLVKEGARSVICKIYADNFDNDKVHDGYTEIQDIGSTNGKFIKGIS